jgi:hypothetical protein
MTHPLPASVLLQAVTHAQGSKGWRSAGRAQQQVPEAAGVALAGVDVDQLQRLFWAEAGVTPLVPAPHPGDQG